MLRGGEVRRERTRMGCVVEYGGRECDGNATGQVEYKAVCSGAGKLRLETLFTPRKSTSINHWLVLV